MNNRIDPRDFNVQAFCEINGFKSLLASKGITPPYPSIAVINRFLMKKISDTYGLALDTTPVSGMSHTSFSVHLDRLYFIFQKGLIYAGLSTEEALQAGHNSTYYMEIFGKEVSYEKWVEMMKLESIRDMNQDILDYYHAILKFETKGETTCKKQ